jgi:transcription initiation factor IIF auxiliary subunit
MKKSKVIKKLIASVIELNAANNDKIKDIIEIERRFNVSEELCLKLADEAKVAKGMSRELQSDNDRLYSQAEKRDACIAALCIEISNRDKEIDRLKDENARALAMLS